MANPNITPAKTAAPKAATAAAAGPGGEVEFVHIIGGPKIKIDRVVVTLGPVGPKKHITILLPTSPGKPGVERSEIPAEEIVGVEIFPRWRAIGTARATAPVHATSVPT